MISVTDTIFNSPQFHDSMVMTETFAQSTHRLQAYVYEYSQHQATNHLTYRPLIRLFQPDEGKYLIEARKGVLIFNANDRFFLTGSLGDYLFRRFC